VTASERGLPSSSHGVAVSEGFHLADRLPLTVRDTATVIGKPA